MARDTDTTALVDNLLRLVTSGLVISSGLISPQTMLLLDKPVGKLFDKLDERAKDRKLKITVKYMRQQGLLVGDYEHGLQLSKKAKNRLIKLKFDNLEIKKPKTWDHKWRLVMFDIPEEKRTHRILFTRKIRSMGFQPLQQSIWIHPFPSKDVIALSCREYSISRWVTYIETNHIDHENKLKKRFSNLL